MPDDSKRAPAPKDVRVSYLKTGQFQQPRNAAPNEGAGGAKAPYQIIQRGHLCPKMAQDTSPRPVHPQKDHISRLQH